MQIVHEEDAATVADAVLESSYSRAVTISKLAPTVADAVLESSYSVTTVQGAIDVTVADAVLESSYSQEKHDAARGPL